MKGRVAIISISTIVLAVALAYLFRPLHSWKTWSLALSGKVIVLDAGHGGFDGGAEKNGVMEKDITLKIAKKTRDYLQEQGAVVFLTRETDKDLAGEQTGGRKTADLQARVEMINRSGADFFMSIHLNSFPSSSSRGAQTFYFGSKIKNQRAAKLIQSELKKSLENTTRIAKQIQHVYLLKKAKIPGVLVEVGFLSNEEERQLLQTTSYQNKIAEALYRGIIRYFTDKKM